MPTSEQQKILDIKVRYEDAISGIVKYKQKIDELKQAEAALGQQYAEDIITEEQYRTQVVAINQAITTYKEDVRVLNKEIQNNIKAQRENEGSLTQLRAQLSNLTRAYDQLDKESREGEFGQNLKKQILDITAQLKTAEGETERFYRNVGNYENSIKNALGANSKYVQGMQMVSDVTKNGIAPAMTIAKNSVVTFGKSLLGLLANPIVATLTAIAGAIMLVSKGISSSEENSNKWAVIIAPLNRLLTAMLSVVQEITGAILSWVNNGARLVGWIMTMMEKLPIIGNMIKGINNAIRESIDIANTDAKLAQQRRDMEVQNAKDELEIAKLRKKAAGEDRSNNAKRIADLKRAEELEKGIMKRRVEYAKVDYENEKRKADQAQNDAKTNDMLAQKEAAYYQVQTQYYSQTIRMAGQVATAEQNLQKQYTATANSATDKAQAIEQAKQRELQAVRSAEDALIALIVDSRIREREQIRVEYDRRIEDLRASLEKEKNLTATARAAILTEIKAQEQLRQKELDELSAEQTAKDIERERERLDLLLEAAGENNLKRRELTLAQLDLEEQAEQERITKEVEDTEKRNEMLLALQLAFNQRRLDVEAEYDQAVQQAQLKAIEDDYAQRIAAAGENELEAARLRMEQSLEILNASHQLEGESIEEWNERRLELEQDYIDKKKALADKEVQIEKAKAEGIAKVFGGLSAVAAAFGEENKALAQASKILALGEIAVNTGVALAEGIKQAQSVPFPANIGAIATTVATILANIATAIKTVKSAKFARGGAVYGAGTATSDSIPAQLSNGESVVTSSATSMFSPILSAFNQLGGGAPIVVDSPQQQLGEDMLAAAVARGMQQAPRPVVTVEEINRVQNQVEVIEKLSVL